MASQSTGVVSGVVELAENGDPGSVMQDGIRTGDLGSQSGDHGVSIDPTSLERLEVVKGPATLLYGSNAIGGVVNAITPQESFSRSRPQGTRGQLIADVGTTNAQLAPTERSSMAMATGSFGAAVEPGGRLTTILQKARC